MSHGCADCFERPNIRFNVARFVPGGCDISESKEKVWPLCIFELVLLDAELDDCLLTSNDSMRSWKPCEVLASEVVRWLLLGCRASELGLLPLKALFSRLRILDCESDNSSSWVLERVFAGLVVDAVSQRVTDAGCCFRSRAALEIPREEGCELSLRADAVLFLKNAAPSGERASLSPSPISNPERNNDTARLDKALACDKSMSSVLRIPALIRERWLRIRTSRSSGCVSDKLRSPSITKKFTR
mmetsp:Transcript_1547/g.4136  ORF Transcript_1547/g.4136 Transcript_1547/m.4136 type:complete len:244 (-) Transcript_1547:162-893(-)